MGIVNKWLDMRKVSVARDASLIHINQNGIKKGDNVGCLRGKTESEAVLPGVVLELSHVKYC